MIAGPTASGKTGLALDIAEHFDAEIIGADSRQFYKGMDIGTAKPTKEELQRVPHHFVDFLEPNEHYSAGTFEQEAIDFLERYFQRKQVAVLVGGSGLFIKAVTEGFDALPVASEAVRKKWQKALEEKGIAYLQAELQRLDPEYAKDVDLSNPQRLIRALEVIDSSGEKFSDLRRGAKKQRSFEITQILLEPERQTLYERIDERVDQMMQLGLLDEVKRMLPYRNENALNAVGYKELFSYLSGEWTLEEAVDKIKQHTRNFAKRQYTWFRKQEGFTSFSSNDSLEIKKHLQEILHVS